MAKLTCRECGTEYESVDVRVEVNLELSHRPKVGFLYCPNTECGMWEICWTEAEARYLALRDHNDRLIKVITGMFRQIASSHCEMCRSSLPRPTEKGFFHGSQLCKSQTIWQNVEKMIV